MLPKKITVNATGGRTIVGNRDKKFFETISLLQFGLGVASQVIFQDILLIIILCFVKYNHS